MEPFQLQMTEKQLQRDLFKPEMTEKRVKPEFTIAIFILYKPQIAVTILDLKWMTMNRNA